MRLCLKEMIPIAKKEKMARGRLRAPPVADTASKKEWRNKEYCDALQASKTTMLQQEGDVR